MDKKSITFYGHEMIFDFEYDCNLKLTLNWIPRSEMNWKSLQNNLGKQVSAPVAILNLLKRWKVIPWYPRDIYKCLSPEDV